MLAFDALYSIADLHLGGQVGFRIVHDDAVVRLANAIRGLATERPNERVALVLNGDIIDTLAEPAGPAIRVDEGVCVFEKIANDPSFGAIFDALGVFVKSERRTLIVGIGNHDLELALPEVQEAFVRRVARDDAPAAARIRFTPPCQPMLFSVGGHRVFITHGNEVDEWNVVDADQLVWAIDRRMRGHAFDADGWKPNAGTRLVLGVMNELKRSHPFVDLLKPEMGLAVPMLVALDKTAFKKLPGVGVAVAIAATTKPRRLALLDEQRTAQPSKDLLGEALARVLAKDTTTGQTFLEEAEERSRTGVAPEGAGPGTLGAGSIAWAVFASNLQSATLGWLRGQEDTFNPLVPDDMDTALINRIGDGISVVIAGHTHLPRSLKPAGKGFWYLNTGTWARVIELKRSEVQDADRWKEVETAMRAGTMAALDAPITALGGRPLARTTGLMAAVEIVGPDGQRHVQASLRRCTADAGESPTLGGVHDLGAVRG